MDGNEVGQAILTEQAWCITHSFDEPRTNEAHVERSSV